MYKSLQGARKNGGKTRVYIWRELQTKTSSIQLKLLLPAILISSLPRFIEKIRKHNWFVKKINNFKSERTFETPDLYIVSLFLLSTANRKQTNLGIIQASPRIQRGKKFNA